jgi:glycine cleavage system H lipoate-binding protein/ABC-type phosphate transport system substrate-binding protein
MKKTILGFIGLLLICCSNLYSGETLNKNDQSPGNFKSIVSTPELLSLTNRLASEYNSLNPEVKINVIGFESVNGTSFNANGTNSGIISGSNISEPGIEPLWKMTIGREVTVPVMNSKNPFLEELYRRGIPAEKFADVFQNPDKRFWSSFLPGGKNVPVHIYILNDESVIAGVKKFLNLDRIPADGINQATEEEIIAAIQKDPYAIGFCKLAGIIAQDKQNFAENIKLLPIDKNGNGKIDNSEQIYNDPDAFSRGVWIGKYPRALFTDLYYVSAVQPTGEAETAFIKWILTDGQKYLYTGGFDNLVFSERQSKLDKFNSVKIVLPPEEKYSYATLAVIILSAIIVLSIIISIIIYFRRNKKLSAHPAGAASNVVFNENSVIAPRGLYFDKTHTWAFMEKNGMVRIGIDDFIQHVIGPVTRVEMKMPGDKIKKGDVVLSLIQKGKQLKIYAPVSGTVREQNSLLFSDSTVINSSPYSEGWVYMVEPSNWLREIQFFDMAEKYRKSLQNEFSRLKDFLSTSLKVNKVEYEHVVLQDGGALSDGILEDLGPEVWEDFQQEFLNQNN